MVLRFTASPAAAHVFQMPIEMRSVGCATLAAVAADAAAELGAASAHEIDLPKQIVQAIRLQWNQGIGDARITLQPEYLGEMSIAIRVEHGAVTAELESSVPAVREWIDSHQPMPRQALLTEAYFYDAMLARSNGDSERMTQRLERIVRGGFSRYIEYKLAWFLLQQVRGEPVRPGS